MGRYAAVLRLTVRDRVADDVGQVLVQRSAARDIKRLSAATDPQDRQA
jgi:hypothetical protein